MAAAEARRDAWRPLLLLALTLTSAGAARGLFSPVQEAAKAELGLTDVQISLVQGLAAAIPVAVLAIPLGRLVDRANRVRILIAMALTWTAGSLLTAAAKGLALLFVARMLAGLGALSALPVAISIAADLAAPERRGRSLLLLSLGVTVGGASAFALGGLLFAALTHAGHRPAGLSPWRAAHLVFGAASALLVLPLLLLREPARRELGEAGDHADLAAALAELWARRAFLGPLFVGQISVVMADTAAGVWAAPVLGRRFHLQPGEFGAWMGAVVLLAGLAGALIGGLAADVGNRRGGRGGVLLGAVVASAIGVPASLFSIAPGVPSFAAALGVLLLTGAISGLVTATAIAILIPNEIRGLTLGAFIVVAAVVGFGLAPTLVAWASGWLGGEAALPQALAWTGTGIGALAFAGFCLAMLRAPRGLALSS